MKHRGLNIILGALLTPGMVFSAWSVAAQTQLEEVLVTARKQEESLQKVPTAVTAVGADMIEALQLNSIEDVARFTPGFSFSKAFGRSTDRPVVRGLSNVLASVQFGVESGAAYFVDGVYYPGDIQSLDIYDLERVEVVRGPQSALYGRNSYSGAINFITRTAQPEAWEGGARVSLGQNGRQDLSLRFSGPLSDALSGGFKLRSHSYDGEWKNRVTGDTIGDEETISFSGNLDWRFGEGTRVRVRFQNNDDEDGTRPFFLQPRTANNCHPEHNDATGEDSNNFLYYCGAIKPRPVALNDGGTPVTDGTGPGATSSALKELITSLGYDIAYKEETDTYIDPADPTYTAMDVADEVMVNRVVVTEGQDKIKSSTYRVSVLNGMRGIDGVRAAEGTFTAADDAGVMHTFVVTEKNFADNSDVARAGVAFSGVERDLQLFSLLAEHELANGHRLVFSTAIREDERTTGSDSDHSPLNHFFAPAFLGTESTIGISETETWEDMSLEFRWESPQDQALRWRAGYFYFSQDKENEEIEFSGQASNGNRDSESSLENTALYASVSYDFAPQWSVDFEIRRQDEEKEQTDYSNSSSTLGAQIYDEDGEWDSTTPRLTLSWAMDENTTLYGIYSEGAKPGGLNGNTGTVNNIPTYEQEESISWEGGLKRVWRDGTVLTNLAAYFIDISELQGTEPVATPTSTGNSVADNKGEGEVFGFEAELRWLLGNGMDLSANYALADSEFTKGCDNTQWFLTSGGGNLGPGGPSDARTTDPNERGDCSIKGNQFAFSPKHTASVVWSYRSPLDTQMMSFLGGGGRGTPRQRRLELRIQEVCPGAQRRLYGCLQPAGCSYWSA